MTLHLTDPHIADAYAGATLTEAGRVPTPRPAPDPTPSHTCDELCAAFCAAYHDAWAKPDPVMPWDATAHNNGPVPF